MNIYAHSGLCLYVYVTFRSYYLSCLFQNNLRQCLFGLISLFITLGSISCYIKGLTNSSDFDKIFFPHTFAAHFLKTLCSLQEFSCTPWSEWCVLLTKIWTTHEKYKLFASVSFKLNFSRKNYILHA